MKFKAVLVSTLLYSLPSFSEDVFKVGIVEQSYQTLRLVNGDLTGNIAGMYRCAFSEMGIPIQFETLPSSRLLNGLRNGSVHIAIPMMQNKGRDEFATFTDPMVPITYHLYSRDKIDLTQPLTGKVFASISHRAHQGAKLKGENPAYKPVKSWKQGAKLAYLKRVDGVVIPDASIKNLAPKYFKDFNKQEFSRKYASAYVSNQYHQKNMVIKKLNKMIGKCSGDHSFAVR